MRMRLLTVLVPITLVIAAAFLVPFTSILTRAATRLPRKSAAT